MHISLKLPHDRQVHVNAAVLSGRGRGHRPIKRGVHRRGVSRHSQLPCWRLALREASNYQTCPIGTGNLIACRNPQATQQLEMMKNSMLMAKAKLWREDHLFAI
jgi:hypothetical protein